MIFMLSLALPVFAHVGELRLTPYRIVLFATFVPLSLIWGAGRMGRILLSDVLILVSCLWSALAFAIAHGFPLAVEMMGIVVVQTFGPYLLGRYTIRGPEQFRKVVLLLFIIVVSILPFSMYESITGKPLALQLFSMVAPTLPNVYMESRLGLDRAQGVFEHPILYGIFCSTAFGLSYYCLFRNSRSVMRFSLPSIVLLAAFISLSTGALLSIVIQIGLSCWDYLIRWRHRWRLFALLVVSGYVTIDLMSNRTPFELFVAYLTFNTASAYNRVLIWHYGVAEVLRHPIFGIGFHEWERAHWMSASIDNFWLLIAVSNGLPALVCLFVAMLIICWRIGRQQRLSQKVERYRKGLLITLTAIFVAICSVHLWNATFCWLMFLVGSGVWIFNERPKIVRPPLENVQRARSAPRTVIGNAVSADQSNSPVIGALQGRNARL